MLTNATLGDDTAILLFAVRDYHQNKWYSVREDGSIAFSFRNDCQIPLYAWGEYNMESLSSKMDAASCGNPATTLFDGNERDAFSSLMISTSIDYSAHPKLEIVRAIAFRSNGLHPNDLRLTWPTKTDPFKKGSS